MSTHPIYKGFFSYSHHDAETDPQLIKTFTNELEAQINAKLVNARFRIWRDEEGLRTGDKWNDKIEAELIASHVLIVLLSPRWVESDFCRKEYAIFQRAEIGRAIGEYVVPILTRTLDKQAKFFTDEQKDSYERIAARQHRKAITTEFRKLRKSTRTSLVEKLADDIEGMVERVRVTPKALDVHAGPVNRPRKRREFDAQAQNYERVDFVTDAEVVLDRLDDEGHRSVLAHAGFVERLYVQGERARIEFGVRRAFISIRNEGTGRLSRVDLAGGGDKRNAYYTTLHEAPEAITVCIDPPEGKTSLTELPLPAAKSENQLSRIADASGDVKAEEIAAELIVSLDIEGLFVLGSTRTISPRTEAAIKSIMGVVRSKVARANQQTIDPSGLYRRSLPVRERK